jgi:hypothetical protein
MSTKPRIVLQDLLISVKERMCLQKQEQKQQVNDFISKNPHLFDNCKSKLDWLVVVANIHNMLLYSDSRKK